MRRNGHKTRIKMKNINFRKTKGYTTERKCTHDSFFVVYSTVVSYYKFFTLIFNLCTKYKTLFLQNSMQRLKVNDDWIIMGN